MTNMQEDRVDLNFQHFLPLLKAIHQRASFLNDDDVEKWVTRILVRILGHTIQLIVANSVHYNLDLFSLLN